ncbi:MAG TPA: excinuclease ABC subunit UvrA [Pirellulaceae bacterium]|jgi:excinuclease ABC subunit A|nr:excinuclease ABC subunit UvrA [Pirellulaceae bacterium]
MATAIETEAIRIHGARVHNLKDVHLAIPRDKLVVITGVSGSGKSSLAFDTLYAEGQRQYVESLSAQARRFFRQLERPDVDYIEGLEPTICIDQRRSATQRRSSVGTLTEVFDFLRVMLARIGTLHCPGCGKPVKQTPLERIQQDALDLPDGSKAMILAPKGTLSGAELREALEKLQEAGFLRVRLNGKFYELDRFGGWQGEGPVTVDLVLDRVVVREKSARRIRESIQLAEREGRGSVILFFQPPGEGNGAGERHEEATNGTTEKNGAGEHAGWQERPYCTEFACPDCGVQMEAVEPRDFSFNSPYGACPACDGLGQAERFDPALVLPPDDFAEGLLASQSFVGSNFFAKRLREESKPFFAERPPLSKQAWRYWSSDDRRALLRGTGTFPGLATAMEAAWSSCTRKNALEEMAPFRGEVPCGECEGLRLNARARSVSLHDLSLKEALTLPIGDLLPRLREMAFDESEAKIADPLVREIVKRLDFMSRVGVGYLTLGRGVDTLSGGELQRTRLATCVGAGLVGCCYVLDEPTVGLHPRDDENLIAALRDLQRQGNTLVVVEHDEAMMREADWLIDIGPGAGEAGGMVVAEGTPEEVARSATSLTGQYLSGTKRIEIPSRRECEGAPMITLAGASANNLRNVTIRVPLGRLTCVTGVSGSGKSTLIHDTLARALRRSLGERAPAPGRFARLTGAAGIDKLVEIDQSPIGRSPKSSPATYVGVFDEIRKLFATTKEAKRRGYGASRFSFNVAGGRCETCQGQGVTRLEMNFLPDLYLTCSECNGARFNRQTLQVRYRDLTIADVLDLPVERACETFDAVEAIRRPLESLRDVGLGYLRLGQSAVTLSGGEAQRIKLADQLARPDTGRTLFLLDEPTSGLHLDDIRKLLEILQRLVDRGNTALIVEHHMEVVKCADWVIDLGPDGGAGGGRLLAEGPPESIAACPESHTGKALRAALDR